LLFFLQGSRLDRPGAAPVATSPERPFVAQRFDVPRLRLIDEPLSLPELVGMHWINTGRTMFSVSPDGVRACQEA
jgi:hypothetical protein